MTSVEGTNSRHSVEGTHYSHSRIPQRSPAKESCWNGRKVAVIETITCMLAIGFAPFTYGISLVAIPIILGIRAYLKPVSRRESEEINPLGKPAEIVPAFLPVRHDRLIPFSRFVHDKQLPLFFSQVPDSLMFEFLQSLPANRQQVLFTSLNERSTENELFVFFNSVVKDDNKVTQIMSAVNGNSELSTTPRLTEVVDHFGESDIELDDSDIDPDIDSESYDNAILVSALRASDEIEYLYDSNEKLIGALIGDRDGDKRFYKLCNIEE